MRKVITVMLAIGLLVCIGGCGEVAANPMAEIYYNEEKLGNYYSNFELSDSTQVTEGNTFSGTYQGLNGMVILWLYEGDGGFPIDIDYSLKVTEGRVKLIMVSSLGDLVTVGEFTNGYVSDGMRTELFTLKKGLYCLKLVGTDDAVVDFVIQADEGSFVGAE